MEHVVFFPAHDGTPAFRRVGNLPDAVRLVEHLRNVENVSEVSVHALTEVPLAFKPYYKVEVPTDAPAAEPQPALVDGPITLAPEAAAPAAEAEAPVEAAVEVPEQAEAPAEDSAETAAKKDGAASLGFFAS
jgi:hypothetical protein